MTTLEFTHQITGLRGTLTAFTRNFTRDHEERKDLVQDTILKALKYRDRFTADTNLKGWLFIIMRNTFINNYRQAQRRRTATDRTEALLHLHVEDTYTFHRPAAAYEYADLWKNVHAIRDELLIPFKMYLSGYKYHEIAEHLQVPIGTVKNRIFSARKEIQKKLHGY
jgi:RNA polymerase sigma-70 factor (ECF subfamily)